MLYDLTRTGLIELDVSYDSIRPTTKPNKLMKKLTPLHFLKRRLIDMVPEKFVVRNNFKTIKGKYRKRLKDLNDENVRLKYELRKLQNRNR